MCYEIGVEKKVRVSFSRDDQVLIYRDLQRIPGDKSTENTWVVRPSSTHSLAFERCENNIYARQKQQCYL